MQERLWILPEEFESQEALDLSDEININPTLAQMLVDRGVDTFDKAKTFFRPNINDLFDPFLMKDMDVAVDRLNEAISNGEKILVYGDYDVDGSTSVSMFYGFMRTHYDRLDYYIPDRYNEGYGVSTAGIDYAKESGCTLIVSIDCGIKAIEKIEYAASLGIDFIVCDHHRPGEKLPPAIAVLDPKRDDCTYPFDELCGCGVAFKLLQGFCIQNTIDLEPLFDCLDLVAIATASDIVPIVGENRILTYYGLKKLNESPRPGIQALVDVSGFEKEITVSNIVFGIGPRINAAGRIDHARGAVEVLLAPTLEAASGLAAKVNKNNNSRKDLDKSITKDAIQQIEMTPGFENAKSAVLYNANWHKGVIGIVASRCIENYYRPTIVLTESHGKAAGSARSVDGFDVYEAISDCSHLLEQFGGHKYAAGMTMEIDKIPAFREKFEEVVTKRITADQLIPKIRIDAELRFSQITGRFFNIMKQMEPFGPGNLRPQFMSTNVCNAGGSRIVKEDHLKLDLSQDDGGKLQGIAFGMAHFYDQVNNGEPFDVCYTIEENTFRGNTTLQMMVIDLKFGKARL